MSQKGGILPLPATVGRQDFARRLGISPSPLHVYLRHSQSAATIMAALEPVLRPGGDGKAFEPLMRPTFVRAQSDSPRPSQLETTLTAERASSSRPSCARAAPNRKCDADNFGWPPSPAEATRPPAPNCRGGASPTRGPHPDVSHRIARTEAQGLGNVSLRFVGATDEDLTKPDKAWALARFRSSANACSHSAMPCAAGLVNISTSPRSRSP